MTDTTTPSMREAFESWYYASKYNQVVYANKQSYQMTFDGWQAATANMHKDFDALWNIYRERVDKVSAQIKTIAELEAKIAELQKDADRYQKLKQSIGHVDSPMGVSYFTGGSFDLITSDNDLDKVIDSAIAEEGVK